MIQVLVILRVGIFRWGLGKGTIIQNDHENDCDDGFEVQCENEVTTRMFMTTAMIDTTQHTTSTNEEV